MAERWADDVRLAPRVRSAALVALVPLSAIVACSATHDASPGAIMIAIDTNLKVPDDIDEIGVAVATVGGASVTADTTYQMAPAGLAKFPATLAVVRGTDKPIDIKVAGYKSGHAFALREAVTTIPSDHTALLRLDLDWLDNNSTSGTDSSVQSLMSTCPSGQTSVGGSCASFQLDSLSLPAYDAASIVSSESKSCLNVTSCLLDTPPALSIARADLVTGAAGDGGTSCTFVPRGTVTAGAFNVALVLPSPGDGWCNAASCIIPLENDAVEGWQLESDGLVHLPASVCANAKVQSLALVPVTTACPLYGPLHPACQDYGDDAGFASGTSGGDGSVVIGGGQGGFGTSDGGSTITVTDGGTTSGEGVSSQGLGEGTTILGFSLDEDDQTLGVIARTGDAGAEFAQVTTFMGGIFPSFVSVDPAATEVEMASTSAQIAVARATGLQVLSVPDMADAGWYPTGGTPPADMTYESVDGGLRLAFTGDDDTLSWVQADGGFVQETSHPTEMNTVVTAIAYEPTQHKYAIASQGNNAGFGPSMTSYAIDLASLDDPAPTDETPFAQPTLQTDALAFADATTVVWAASGNLYVAATSARGTTGTMITPPFGLRPNAHSLAGGGGRIFWIGGDENVYMQHVAAGVPSGTPTDLSTSVLQGTIAFQIAVGSTYLYWTDGSALYRYPLGGLP